ncbi:MAG: hypothetical protein KA146_04775 [Leptospiraceae bacterium]|nr:hypothetical protein [Leptospiraceae bacterium]
MITLIRIFLENVAGVVGDIVILDWNRQTVTKAKSEGLNSPALSYVRSFGIFALSVPATRASWGKKVDLFFSKIQLSLFGVYVLNIIISRKN